MIILAAFQISFHLPISLAENPKRAKLLPFQSKRLPLELIKSLAWWKHVIKLDNGEMVEVMLKELLNILEQLPKNSHKSTKTKESQ